MDHFSVNPFVYQPTFKKKDFLLFILMTPLALIKLIISAICILIIFLTASIALIIKQIHRPLNYHEVKKYYIKIPMFFLNLILLILGIKVTEVINHNKNKSFNANMYVFAPHSSMYDVVALFKLGVTTAVARDETKNIWLLSKFILLLDPILVKRENAESRQETIRQIKIRAKHEKIAIFPEGTCTNRFAIIKFRLGAFTPGLPIQPVYIDYEKNNENNTVWAHEGPKIYTLILYTLFKWKTHMKIHLLPVYYPTRSEIEEPWKFAHNLQNFFCSYFNLQKSVYNFEDPRFLYFTKIKGIPRSPTCLKLVKICYKTLTGNYSIKKNLTTKKKGTSSSQIIAAKTKNSIGSLNSLIDFNNNWIFDLEAFIKTFVTFLLDKMNNMNDLKTPITSSQSLINFFELNQKFPGIENSTTFEDFFTSISGSNSNNKTTFLDLFIILNLCDISIYSLKDRIDNCIMKLEDLNNKKLNRNNFISYNNFTKLMWHLIGIDEQYLPESIFKMKKISIDFFKKDIATVFKRAVFENAPDLLEL